MNRSTSRGSRRFGGAAHFSWSEQTVDDTGSATVGARLRSRVAHRAPHSAAAPPLFPRTISCNRRVITAGTRALTSCLSVPAAVFSLVRSPVPASVFTASPPPTKMLDTCR